MLLTLDLLGFGRNVEYCENSPVTSARSLVVSTLHTYRRGAGSIPAFLTHTCCRLCEASPHCVKLSRHTAHHPQLCPQRPLCDHRGPSRRGRLLLVTRPHHNPQMVRCVTMETRGAGRGWWKKDRHMIYILGVVVTVSPHHITQRSSNNVRPVANNKDLQKHRRVGWHRMPCQLSIQFDTYNYLSHKYNDRGYNY